MSFWECLGQTFALMPFVIREDKQVIHLCASAVYMWVCGALSYLSQAFPKVKG